MPGVGWAAGTDRLALLLEKPKNTLPSVGLIAMDDVAQGEAFKALHTLRGAMIPSQIFYSGNSSKQMKKADKRNCDIILLFGEQESLQKVVTLKVLATGDQHSIPLDQLVETIRQKRKDSPK